jgi:hypothetical protein
MNDELVRVLMRLAQAQGLISKSLHTAEREKHAHSGCRHRKRISAPQLRGVSRETLLRKNISRQRLKWSHWGKADTEQAVRHPIYEYAT